MAQLESGTEAEVLRLRALQLAETAPRADSDEDGATYLVFLLARQRYAIDTLCIESVVALSELARIPGAPSYLAGVTQVKGEIVAVFDLSELLGTPRRGVADQRSLILIRDSTVQFAVLAEAVEEVVWSPASAILPIGEPGLICGILPQKAAVIDGELLLSDPRLFIGELLGGEIWEE